MKVAELINLLSIGTRYKLIGAETGLPLYKCWTNKNLDKYKDLEVADTPIEASFQIQRGVDALRLCGLNELADNFKAE